MVSHKRVRTPVVLQTDATECGAASLGIILGYHHRFVPSAELRRECGVSRDGSKAANILKAAARYGLKGKGYSKQLVQLQELKPPFIVFWRFNHFLVVEGCSPKYVYLNDPVGGHRHILWKDFDAGFTGVVLMFERRPEFRPGGRPLRIGSSLWKRYTGNYAGLLICLLAGLLLVLPGLAIPAYTRVFLDAIISDGHFGWFRPLLVAMGVTLVLQVLLNSIQLLFLRRLKIGLSAKLKSQFYWHLLRLPVDFYGQRYPGEVVHRAELNDRVADLMTGELVKTAISLATMVVYGTVLLVYDVWLASIGIGLALLNLAALRWVSQRRVEANLKVAQDEGKVHAVTIAGISDMDSLKAAGAEDALFAKVAGYYAKAFNARQELQASTIGVNVLPNVTTLLTSVLILVVGAFRVMDGSITIGMLLAIQLLMSNFLAPIESLVHLGTRLQELHGELNRLDDVLGTETDDVGAGCGGSRVVRDDTAPAGAGDLQDGGAQVKGDSLERPSHVQDGDPGGTRLQGYVDLEKVTFGYSRLERPLIADFDLHIQPGQRVALVGGSGSGKSTLAKLICGFYRPWSGQIRFDGRTREELPRALLSNSLGLVEQDLFLFEGTVRDNLTLWDPTRDDAGLWQALTDADIDATVANLQGGLDAEFLEAGANLSGGQRQRVEIARALVSHPSILVLDEATSALDAETERLIDENIRRRGCTTIIVAHRLSTIRDCDEIIVLERGRVVERGVHEDLWNAGGLYHELLRHGDGGVESQCSTA
ncbi:MAG: NHLP family bacteriocin export ABC transporter peptidase/permease/ATPase subunit [Planctomycetota bacterium]|nr:NHLP family bacteriocin export ABC transporter peptidase/permease/ATPase subunit [Planctomycetota bacterium]